MPEWFWRRSSPKIRICVTRIRLGEGAKDDLRDIRTYSKAQFGSAVAKAYLNGLDAVFAMLSQRPHVGALEEDLDTGIRGFAYRSHRIYYRVADDAIIVVRVLHHARDARRWIGDQA